MWFQELLLDIWAHSPIFALTNDAYFLAGKTGNSPNRFHFSIISLLLGEHLFQLFSFPIRCTNESFAVFRHIQMSQMENFNLPSTRCDELIENYKVHCNSLNEEDLRIEKEALLRQIEIHEIRRNVSNSKINILSAVILVLIPLLLSNFDWKAVPHFRILEVIIFCCFIYCIINVCAWVFQSVKVRGRSSSSFGDLKSSDHKEIEFNTQLYFDWQHIKREADKEVSFVSYLHESLRYTFVLGLILFAIQYFPSVVPTAQSNSQVYNFTVTSVHETYDSSAIEWARLVYELQKDQYSEVIVLYNCTDITPVYESLKQFTHQEIEWLTDTTLENDSIKIILED